MQVQQRSWDKRAAFNLSFNRMQCVGSISQTGHLLLHRIFGEGMILRGSKRFIRRYPNQQFSKLPF